MRSLGLRRCALAMGMALLAGCGASQPPIGAPGAQASALASPAYRGESWVLPEAKSEDLLYVSSLTEVRIHSYPSYKVVGVLGGFGYTTGLCSDRNGHVWVTDSRNSLISEYAHAGTKPIVRLSDGNEPVGCAVDPRSGDLAVANYPDNIWVYPKGTSNPIIYTAPDFYFIGILQL